MYTMLLESVHDWSIAQKNERFIDVSYTDFQEAFDSWLLTHSHET